jgi:hypothetical protein
LTNSAFRHSALNVVRHSAFGISAFAAKRRRRDLARARLRVLASGGGQH